MSMQTTSAKLAFDTLIHELSCLSNPDRIVEGLNFAARLIEESAYAFAHEVSGEQIAALIVLAARVEGEAEKIARLIEDQQD